MVWKRLGQDLRRNLHILALLDEGGGQTQLQLADQLNGSQSTVFDCLEDMEQILKVGMIMRYHTEQDRSRKTIERLNWEPLAHAVYSLDLALSDNYLFSSLTPLVCRHSQIGCEMKKYYILQ